MSSVNKPDDAPLTQPAPATLATDGEQFQNYPRFSLLRLLLITLNISCVLAAIRLGLSGAVRWEIAVSLAYAAAVVPWFLWHGITEEWSLPGLLVIAVIGAFLIALCMPEIF
jgi:hypothetical protein